MSSAAKQDQFLALESRIDALLTTLEQLQVENRSLREQQDELIAERARLVEKNDMARRKVELMIERLRALEESQ